jgi:hypothetical protein
VTVVNTELNLSIPQNREISSSVEKLSAYQENRFIVLCNFMDSHILIAVCSLMPVHSSVSLVKFVLVRGFKSGLNHIVFCSQAYMRRVC